MQAHNLFQELLDSLQEGWAGLPDKPEETPRTTLETLWRSAIGANNWLASEEIDPLSDQRLRMLIQQRLDGEPLAYLTGRQAFMGIEFLCSPEAMIPRKETEILGRAAIELARRLNEESGTSRIIDLCTGSGNIALTLAHYEPRSVLYGSDLSADAVQLARRNAQHLGLSERVQFYQGDLFAPFEQEGFWGQIDLVTCNPPYISSAQVQKMPQEIIQHEPHQAFDGGPFGIRILTRLIREAPRFLKAGGWVCFEVGLGQAKAVLSLVNKNGLYTSVEALTDVAGEYRVIKAQYNPIGSDPSL